ncbi:hypothetical protein ACFL2H_08655 [Planctomycetota bacterium]
MKRFCQNTLFATVILAGLQNGSNSQDFVFNQSDQVLMHESWASWHDGANWLGFVVPDSTSWIELDDRNANVQDPPPVQPYRLFFGDYYKEIFMGGSNDHFVLGGEAHVDWLRVQNGHWILDFNARDKPLDPQGHDTIGSLTIGGPDRTFGDVFDVGSAPEPGSLKMDTANSFWLARTRV